MTVDKSSGGRLIGYARVSTIEQNLDMQIEALRKAGVQDRHLHVEKISASAKHRPIFNWALKILRNGDVFVVWRLDRLGRDVRAIHRTLDIIRESGASVRSLTEQIDTDTPIGGFTLNLMASLAQLERDQVVMRTRAGVAARAEKLRVAIRDILARAVDRGGSTLRNFSSADGQVGHFQTEAMVYGRTGQPCRQCGSPILQIRQGQRSTFYCKVCQKL